MMYGYGGEQSVAKGIGGACKRDLEGEAKRLKGRIEASKALCNAIGEFFKAGYSHWFDQREHRESFMVAFAGLTMEIPALEKEYDFILAEIEKER